MATRRSPHPIDPRPGSDGPANLFVTSNFSLTSNSAAIDNAWEQTADRTDILGNFEAKIGNDGWGLAGYGPRDVGAFEYGGIGGNAVGGAFRVVTTSLVPVGGATYASGGTLVTATSPTTITVTFSSDVSHSSISATDLVLSGSADNSSAPVKATSLNWIDGHTVQFNLSGPLSLPGSLNLSIAPNAIGSASGQGNLGYNDSVVLQLGNPPANVNPTPYPTPFPVTITPTPTTPSPTPTIPSLSVPVIAITPAPATAPVSPALTRAAMRRARRAARRAAHAAHRDAAHHHPAARHVAHSARAHHHVARHVVKIKAAHPRATVSLALSMAGHHHHQHHHHHHHKKSV